MCVASRHLSKSENDIRFEGSYSATQPLITRTRAEAGPLSGVLRSFDTKSLQVPRNAGLHATIRYQTHILVVICAQSTLSCSAGSQSVRQDKKSRTATHASAFCSGWTIPQPGMCLAFLHGKRAIYTLDAFQSTLTTSTPPSTTVILLVESSFSRRHLSLLWGCGGRGRLDQACFTAPTSRCGLPFQFFIATDVSTSPIEFPLKSGCVGQACN